MRGCLFWSLLLCLLVPRVPEAQEVSDTPRKVWAGLMGQWRVTNQPKRGSNVGAWTREARIEWQKNGPGQALQVKIQDSPAWNEVHFSIDPEQGTPASLIVEEAGVRRSLKLMPVDSSDRYVFQDESAKSQGERWTLNRKSLDRWTILVESRREAFSPWKRVSEIGLTRLGTTIALGDGARKCVVTGGLGETPVEVNGKTYYVCCSGCREALLADPAAFVGTKQQGKPKN